MHRVGSKITNKSNAKTKEMAAQDEMVTPRACLAALQPPVARRSLTQQCASEALWNHSEAPPLWLG